MLINQVIVISMYTIHFITVRSYFFLLECTETVYFPHEFGGKDVKEDKNLELEFWKQVWEKEMKLLCQA